MMAERTFAGTYALFSIFMTSIVYPVSYSWVNGGGWLSELGFHDAAGACYIHMLGGLSGLVGTILMGPRHGIFDANTINELR